MNYVWSAYALAAVLLTGLFWQSYRQRRQAQYLHDQVQHDL